MAGFERGDFARLSDLKREISEKFVYMTDKEKHGLIEHWEDSSTLKAIRNSGVTRFTGDCEEFALVSMDKLRNMGFHVRLVATYVETGDGHLICEVASSDYTEAYYFDNRQVRVVVRKDLRGYKFVSTSPWDPVPAETRQWVLVTTKQNTA